MKSLLICPEAAKAVRDLTRNVPLAAVPLLGKPLIVYWIEHLAGLGAREIIILSSDRPDKIRDVVTDGAAWGVKIEVVPGREEMTLQEAREHYVAKAEDWLPTPYAVVEIRGLPNNPARSIDHSFETFFTAVRCWMPYAMKNRVGMREVAAGVWISLRSNVSPKVILRAPCWIQDNAYIGDGATVGPMAVLENNVIVGDNAIVAHSIVQPNTYIGEMTTVEDSIVVGTTLINWKNGSVVKIQDNFLLGNIAEPRGDKYTPSLFGRFMALNVMVLTAPLAGLCVLSSWLRGRNSLKRSSAVRSAGRSDVLYYQFNDRSDYVARWPQLWNIVRGEFAWFGNRPLTQHEASQLNDDFEKLWLESPIGLFSQADAAGCWDKNSDEAKVHASFYSAQRNWNLNYKILTSVLNNRPSTASGGAANGAGVTIKDKFSGFRQLVSDFLSL